MGEYNQGGRSGRMGVKSLKLDPSPDSGLRSRTIVSQALGCPPSDNSIASLEKKAVQGVERRESWK